jgi:hypothetical protein
MYVSIYLHSPFCLFHEGIPSFINYSRTSPSLCQMCVCVFVCVCVCEQVSELFQNLLLLPVRARCVCVCVCVCKQTEQAIHEDSAQDAFLSSSAPACARRRSIRRFKVAARRFKDAALAVFLRASRCSSSDAATACFAYAYSAAIRF